MKYTSKIYLTFIAHFSLVSVSTSFTFSFTNPFANIILTSSRTCLITDVSIKSWFTAFTSKCVITATFITVYWTFLTGTASIAYFTLTSTTESVTIFITVRGTWVLTSISKISRFTSITF